MSDDKRDILETLKFELAFLEQGGYGRSVRTPQTPTRSFQDSLTCLNFSEPTMPHPCSECFLTDFVPKNAQGELLYADWAWDRGIGGKIGETYNQGWRSWKLGAFDAANNASIISTLGLSLIHI